MLRLAAGLIAAGALALAAGGCGDDESTTVTETETVTEGAAAETTGTEAETSSDGEAPPADETVTKLTGFTSPTGNIGCLIDLETVRCDIEQRDWEPPPAPKGCKLDYGQGIALSAGAAPEFVCAGDTTLGAGDPLPYGSSIGAGLLRCESAESGITCTDAESGRGFSLSQQAYELF